MLIARLVHPDEALPHAPVGGAFILRDCAPHHSAWTRRTPQGVPAELARLNVYAFGMVLAFGITWGLAIVYRKQTSLHVRFMISTAFAIATATVFRIFFFWVPSFDTDEAAINGNYFVLTLLLLALIAADWRMGVKRSAFWVVTILISVMHLGYWTFGKTDEWLAFCQWYADLPSWVS